MIRRRRSKTRPIAYTGWLAAAFGPWMAGIQLGLAIHGHYGWISWTLVAVITALFAVAFRADMHRNGFIDRVSGYLIATKGAAVVKIEETR